MAGEVKVILSFLYRLRRRALLLGLTELVLMLASLIAMGALVGSALGALGWVHAVMPWLMAAVILVVPVVWTYRVLWPRFRNVSRPKKAAEWVDNSIPLMHNVTLSALELAPRDAFPPGFRLHAVSKGKSTQRTARPVPAVQASSRPEAATGRSSSSAEAGFGTATHAGLASGVDVQGYSPLLIAATVQQAAEKVEALEPESLLPVKPLQPWFLSAVMTLVPLTILMNLSPGALEAGLGRFFFPPTELNLQSLEKAESGLEGPALADITLTMTYPAYLKRETETLENASGEIRAPKGTRVDVSARAASVPARAELVLAGLAPVAAPVDADGRFSASFVLIGKTTWRMALYDSAEEVGSGTARPPTLSRAYPVEVEEDGIPTIDVLNLAESTEVTVNQPVTISFKAQDDHGLTRIELVVAGPNKTTRTRLADFSPPIDRDEQSVDWFPREEDIPPGSSVEVWLEVADDDTVSGPKLGRSAHYRMVLASDERKRDQNLQSKEELKEALIATLGDSLVVHEEPMRNRTPLSYLQELQQLAQNMLKVRQGFVAVRKMMDDDRNEEVVVYKAVVAMEKDLLSADERLEEALKERSQAGNETRVRISPMELRTRREDFITLLENAVLSMESFANMQRMESIMAQGETLKKAGQDLRSLLEEAKKSGKKPDMKALMEKLQQMQQQLAKMSQEMSKLDRSSAEWYQNPAGETKEVKDSLSELQKALEEGKTEDAMKLLEDYMKNTDELMQAMEKMQKEEFKNDREEAGKDMASVIDGLRDIEDQQKRLLSDSSAVQDQIKRQSGTSQSQLEELNRQALQKLDDMRKAVNRSEQSMRDANGGALPQDSERRMREARDRMNTLEAALKVQDINRSLQASQDSSRTFRSLDMDASRMERSSGQAMSGAHEANAAGKKAADGLTQDLQKLMERMDQAQQQAAQQGQGLAGRQQSLQQKGQGLAEKLGEYSKDSPVIPSKWGERLKQASQSMEGAAGKLEGGELAGGVAQQQAALQEVTQLRKEMEQVQKEMQQQARGGGSQQQQSAGTPESMAQGQKPSQGPPQNVQPSRGGNGKSENWGRGGVRSDTIDISKDYRAPEEYRREIMEGMKGEAPSRYKRLNREYYEKLVR